MPLLQLSPSGGLARVCSENQLQLTCNSTETHLEWAIRRTTDGPTIPVHILDYRSTADQTFGYLLVDSVFFNTSRVSPTNSLPLISVLVISPTNSSINGTEVICRDVSQNSITQSAFVHVVNRDSIPGTLILILTNYHSRSKLTHLSNRCTSMA